VSLNYYTTAVNNLLQLSISGMPVQWRSQPKSFGRGKSFDFRRATVFSLGHRLSKHKRTRYLSNCCGHGP